MPNVAARCEQRHQVADVRVDVGENGCAPIGQVGERDLEVRQERGDVGAQRLHRTADEIEPGLVDDRLCVVRRRCLVDQA